jgi:hypothetical protein
MTLVGYPLFGLIASALDWESTVVSLPFRIVVIVLSAMIVMRLGRSSSAGKLGPWLISFWFIYLMRLGYDAGVVGMQGAVEAIVFFVAISLLPALGNGVAGVDALSQRRTAWLLATTGGTICVIAILMSLLGWGQARAIDASSSGGRLAFEAVNPITLGHVAVTTLVALICLTRERLKLGQWLLLIGVGYAASWCMLLAASRGPILCLGAVGVVYALATGRWLWILLMSAGIAAVLVNTETALMARFSQGVDDPASLERLFIQGNAILQFLSSPIFGSAFAELESLTYPHNLFIETAMALGMIGLILLFGLLIVGMLSSIRLMRRGEFLQPLLLLQYFLAAQFSGSLWGAPALWSLLAIVGRVRSMRAQRRLATPAPPSAPAGPQPIPSR